MGPLMGLGNIGSKIPEMIRCAIYYKIMSSNLLTICRPVYLLEFIKFDEFVDICCIMQLSY